jgi:23S rRNA (adenine2503-C2)-methyltransferase
VRSTGALETLHSSGINSSKRHVATRAVSVEDGANVTSSGLLDQSNKVVVKNLSFDQLIAFCRDVLEEAYPEKRAKQLWRWMYSDHTWIRSLEDAAVETTQNGFSKAFRDKFDAVATVDGGLRLVNEHIASDGTIKLVFELTTGAGKGGKIETVLIPVVREHESKQGAKERITLCVSSQLGCAMGCKFCWTGKLGLLGNLSTAQIVEQVVAARRYHYEKFGDLERQRTKTRRYVTPITNIVYMGMGEPLDNLEAVVGSLNIVKDHAGLHFSHNKVTVSTVGLVPEMRQLLERTSVSLAVSLHGATNEVRGSIVPVNGRYPVDELILALEELFPIDKKTAQHVLIEYTMMDGVNDRVQDAEALLQVLKNVKCKVNLIVFNPHEGTQYAASTDDHVAAFRDVLIRGGRVVTVRASRGDDEAAACGQLGGNVDDAKALKRELLGR